MQDDATDITDTKDMAPKKTMVDYAIRYGFLTLLAGLLIYFSVAAEIGRAHV